MGVRPILLFPHQQLFKPCRFTPLKKSLIAPIIQDLKDTMYHSPGVGLAAPQIGVMEQISVIDVRRKPRGDQKHIDISAQSGKLLVLINPILVKGTGTQIPREGCLSVPDLLANVRRFQRVRVKTGHN